MKERGTIGDTNRGVCHGSKRRNQKEEKGKLATKSDIVFRTYRYAPFNKPLEPYTLTTA